jgi:hypothetical protein
VGFAQGPDVGSSVWPSTIPTAVIEAPTSVSPYRMTLPSSPASGVFQLSNPTGTFPQLTGSFSGDSNHSQHLFGLVANVTKTCPASLGGCNVAGFYRLSFYLYSTVACSIPDGATIGPIEVVYTDNAGTKPPVIVPLFSSGTITNSITLGNTTSYAWGTATVWSAGSPNAIQYKTTGYSPCGVGSTGTATYELDATVEQIQ